MFPYTTLFRSDFLPVPKVPEIIIAPDQCRDSIDRLVHDTVQQIYVINRDDFNTREILTVPDLERGPFFDRLRKEYPERREFQNTTVILPADQTRLIQLLSGIGFQIRTSR